MPINQLKENEQVKKWWNSIIKKMYEKIGNNLFGNIGKKQEFYKNFEKQDAITICEHMLSTIYKDHNAVFLANSWHHLVFKMVNKKTGETSSNVVKIKMMHFFNEIFNKIMKKTSKIHMTLEKDYEEESKKFDELWEFFEEKNLLKPKMEKRQFIITDKKIIDDIAEKSGVKWKFNENEIKIEIPYTTQPLAKEIIDKKYINFAFGYSPGAFKETLWIDLPDNSKSKNHDLPITGKQLIEHLDKTFDLLIKMITSMKDDETPILKFFESIIKFDEKHKEILDIYGGWNFTFFLDKDGNMDFHLIDPTHRLMFMKKNTYPSINEKILKWMENRKIGFNEYSKFTYPYVVEKMKKYIKEHK